MIPNMQHVLKALGPAATIPDDDGTSGFRKLRCVRCSRAANVNYHVNDSDGAAYKCWSRSCALSGNAFDVIMGTLDIDLEAAYAWARQNAGWRDGQSRDPATVIGSTAHKPGRRYCTRCDKLTFDRNKTVCLCGGRIE
jgi:hypothetical protein